MTRPKTRLARGVKMAEAAIIAAYWDACDDAERAVDPVELTSVPWVQECLAEAYEIALAIEAHPEPWDAAFLILMKPIPSHALTFTDLQFAPSSLRQPCASFAHVSAASRWRRLAEGAGITKLHVPDLFSGIGGFSVSTSGD